MGGKNSGRYRYSSLKRTIDDYLAIDIRIWKKKGLIKPHESFTVSWSSKGGVVPSIFVYTEDDYITLKYRYRGNNQVWKDESYAIYLDWSYCNLSGTRTWFLCPAKGCGRRVAILYGGNIFACRNCYHLTYSSQYESYTYRAMRQADKIRNKLEWEPDISYRHGEKPKGMHWKTFDQLIFQHDCYADEVLLRFL